tara:strand:- start:305 stop:538 length:234 start_codon:yes stop_codon:yes gene_type:complete
MLVGIITFFIFIWIVIKAISSNEKVIHVTTIDTKTGNESIEVRKEVRSSAGKTVAQITLWICFVIPAVIIIIFVITS